MARASSRVGDSEIRVLSCKENLSSHLSANTGWKPLPQLRFLAKQMRRPLTLTLPPEYRGEGIKSHLFLSLLILGGLGGGGDSAVILHAPHVRGIIGTPHHFITI